MDYWQQYPPSHITLAAVHLKRDKKQKPKEQAEELRSLVSMFGGAVTRGKKKNGG